MFMLSCIAYAWLQNCCGLLQVQCCHALFDPLHGCIPDAGLQYSCLAASVMHCCISHASLHYSRFVALLTPHVVTHG